MEITVANITDNNIDLKKKKDYRNPKRFVKFSLTSKLTYIYI